MSKMNKFTLWIDAKIQLELTLHNYQKIIVSSSLLRAIAYLLQDMEDNNALAMGTNEWGWMIQINFHK